MILLGLRDRAAAKGEIGHAAMLGISSLETLDPAFGTGRMAKDMLATLSSLCIVPEAGIARRSKAGDVDSVRAAMMQNFAQDAYSRASLKGLAERIPSPYGVNISLLEETTKETLLTTDGQVSSGETARKLSFQIDASDVGDAVLHDAAPVPDHILDIFDKLATEALRGEDPTQRHGEGKSAISAIAISPVPTDRRVIYQLDSEAQAEMAKMLEERTAFKRANKDNTPNLEWAQRGRFDLTEAAE